MQIGIADIGMNLNCINYEVFIYSTYIQYGVNCIYIYVYMRDALLKVI